MTRLALNHMAIPKGRFGDLAAAARRLGTTDIEQTEVRFVAINALKRFDAWNDTRAVEATAALARYAHECSAAALVLCPVNEPANRRSLNLRAEALRTALTALAPILRASAITGLIEPLGFPQSALRTKRAALSTINATATSDTFALLHDTFDHFLSGETELFPLRTMLVHVSGVVDHTLPISSIRDEHRALITDQDRLGTLAQLRPGYTGPVSLEPFVPDCDDHTDLQNLPRLAPF